VLDGVGLLLDPEERLYGGAAAFDAGGRLDAYSGRARAGEQRFAELERRLGERPLDDVSLVASLREMGATFADRPPTVETCRSLAVVAAAIGAGPDQARATRTAPSGSATAKMLGREQLAWRLRIVASLRGQASAYWLVIDPWGEVLSVSRDGRPFP
jgi:hypothetical protein